MTEEILLEYLKFLRSEEREEATCRLYQREIRRFFEFAGKKILSKELVIAYKEQLIRSYSPASVNVKLTALNGFFRFIGKEEWRVRQLKIQRSAYCSKEKELTKAEYLRLVSAAEREGREELSLILQTLCGTGIRVSELSFITAEAVRKGEAVVRLKGKIRIVLLTGKLCRLLKKYAKRRGICSGSIFVTRTGRPLDRSNIWKMLKSLGSRASVELKKIFPHNLRHLFARTFYAAGRDLVKLADVLGHSNINTTRIYIVSSGQEHQRCMDALGLVV